MKEYLVLGALCLFAVLQMLLSGCTTGLVCTPKEPQCERKISIPQEIDKNWERFRSEDGITSYIIRDRNGKAVGMRLVKAPWVKIPAPKCFPVTKKVLANRDRRGEIEKIKTAKTRWLPSRFPLSVTPTFSGDKKGSLPGISISSLRPSSGDEEMRLHAVPDSNNGQVDKDRDTEIGGQMSGEEFNEGKKARVIGRCGRGKSKVEGSPPDPGNDSVSEGNSGEKIYRLGMAFSSKWLPGFMLRAMELRNGEDIRFKIPIPSLDWNVKFGLRFESKRPDLSNNLERTVIGLFTINR